MSFDLKDYRDRKIHMTGIGGPMMSGIAGILMNKGLKVSGSHFAETRALQELRRLGASVKGTYHEDHIHDQVLIVHGEGVAADNPELVRARKQAIPLMKHTELLGGLMENFSHSTGIAGTHGKTSTVSILTTIALTAGLDPTVLAGDRIPPMDSTFRTGSSQIMIVESDEDREAFLSFPPRIAVLLNVEEDHIESFQDLAAVKDAFGRYAALIPEDGLIIANADDPEISDVLKNARARITTFGQEQGDLRARNVLYDGKGQAAFDVMDQGEFLFTVQLPLAGSYSVYNALAAIAAAKALNVPPDKIREGLLALKGVPRRIQTIGQVNGITFVDDYGHHPTEIRLTLESLKNLDHGRLVVAVQPRSYKRLEHFFDDFVPLFDEIDLLILLPVYDREAEEGDFSSERLGDAIRKRFLVPCFNALDFVDAANLVLQGAKPGDLVLLTGSNEVSRIHELIEANWEIVKDR